MLDYEHESKFHEQNPDYHYMCIVAGQVFFSNIVFEGFLSRFLMECLSLSHINDDDDGNGTHFRRPCH